MSKAVLRAALRKCRDSLNRRVEKKLEQFGFCALGRRSLAEGPQERHFRAGVQRAPFRHDRHLASMAKAQDQSRIGFHRRREDILSHARSLRDGTDNEAVQLS